MRNLRGADVVPYEKPKNPPQFEESEALEELMRITSPKNQDKRQNAE